MRKILPLLLLILIALPTSAKLSKFILRGWIEKQDYSKTDWQREAIDSVLVSIIQSDTILVPFKILNGNDSLKITDANLRLIVYGGVGEYTLMLNRPGFEPLRKDFKISSENQDVFNLRALIMEPRRETLLNEVEIVGTAIKMVMKGDTIIYDSAAFKLPEGSTLDALVRQLPGAELDADGSITVNGKKVQSLLLNGNDFFKSDPDVMLKNLPTYVVDKIKVYDKAGDDDNITHASHRLSDSPDAENLVMDVTLKKEFSMATIFNFEGGYGPGIYHGEDPKKFDHRYIGRTFIVGFGKKYRFSVFGNVNNIQNTSRATSSRKDWGGGWGQSGELKVAMGGFDVFYKPNDKVEASADLQYSREDIDLEQLTSSTRFYETGNLYTRSRLEQYDLRHHIIANAGFQYQGDNFYINFTPNVDWFRSSSTEYRYIVNFNANPSELSRGAAIDSLFMSGQIPSHELLESVTSSTYQSYRGHSSSALYPDWLQLRGNLYMSWSPKNMRGVFSLGGNVTDRQEKSQYGRIYDQTLADASAETDPLRRTQWNDGFSRNTNAIASLTYNWHKNFMDDAISNELGVYAEAGWSMERTFDNKILMQQALIEGFDPTERLLPSQIAPENDSVFIDPQNSIRSLFLNNRIIGSLSLSYSRQLLAPTDSGLNPRFGANIGFDHRQHFRHLSYSKAHLQPAFRYVKNAIDPTEGVRASIFFSSNNKLRFFNLNLQYSYSTSLINMFTLIPSSNTSDPLNIYLGPGENANFQSPSNHNLSLSFYRYGIKSHIYTRFFINGGLRRNSIAQTSMFDPATGVTTHFPINVNGNWDVRSNANVAVPFGPRECWRVSANVTYSHDNSVDYTSASGAPIRSIVRNDNLGGSLSVSYKLTNGTRFSLGGGSTWQHAASPRVDFQTISAANSFFSSDIDFYLPWNIEGGTSLRANFRRGYQDASLNTTEWIWNVSVQKTILNGSMTFKLNAVDILGQLSNVSYWVNAQGRTETWTNNLPRYVMLTISYRFSHTPNALK